VLAPFAGNDEQPENGIPVEIGDALDASNGTPFDQESDDLGDSSKRDVGSLNLSGIGI
jgi:hypothetical protein